MGDYSGVYIVPSVFIMYVIYVKEPQKINTIIIKWFDCGAAVYHFLFPVSLKSIVFL